jgi:hypothetical protein
MRTIPRQCGLLVVTGLMAGMAVAADLGDLPDPTNPAGGASAGTASSGVQSILISPRGKQAMIHGRTLGVGDRVGEAVIVDIQPFEVILKRGGRETRMRLVPRLEKQKSGGGAS